MRYIGPYAAVSTPTIADIINACAQVRRNALVPLLPILNAATVRFQDEVPNVHSLEPEGIDADDSVLLVEAYDHRTAAIKRKLAQMQATLPASHSDLCPYCNLDSGAELDHYLPKTTYPEFALYGPNILPICGRCNRSKGKVVANANGERLFLFLAHDLSDDARVLRAEVSFAGAAHVRYFIDDEGVLPEEELALVNRHFCRLKLAMRYTRRANSLLAGLKARLSGKSENLIKKIIDAGLLSAQAADPTNGWQLALYEALDADSQGVVDWLS